MTKELKKLIDETEVSFSFLNRKQLKLLKSYLKLVYIQGKIDYLEPKHEKN